VGLYGRISMAEINDLSICISTANGTGSASANNLLFKSIFKMGIPCSSKNLFPSNIQGLPTRYQIRASGAGYGGRKDVIDVMVAFNPSTITEDLKIVRDGGIVVFDSSKAAPETPETKKLQMIGIPAEKLVKENVKVGPLRIKQRNMIYVGALASLFGIDISVIREVLQDTFGKKPQVIESNADCVLLGFNEVRKSGTSQDLAQLQAIPGGNKGKIITEGNTASALGSIYGGASVVAWYPITPSTSLADAMEYYLPKLRTDANGKATYAVIQAEDEIAAAAMVVGAGWAGSRSMTATSGPGLSLMNEMIGLSYFGEVPSVFFVIQRGGPSTGLPTRTQQSDILSMYYCSHGDTRHVVLLPHDMRSSFDLARRSFDLAERLQGPVFVGSDLDLGMNLWTSEPLELTQEPFDRGKILSASDLEKSSQTFRRFYDQDGDGVGTRTTPGNTSDGASYFTSGALQNADGIRSEDSVIYKQTLDRLLKKQELAKTMVPAPLIDANPEVKIGIISYGSSYDATQEARDRLKAENYATNHLLLRALPLRDEVQNFLRDHDLIYLVEQNRDGQMQTILRDTWPELGLKIRPIRIYDGLPITAGDIVRQVRNFREVN
jgi:2-oxoglutarate/2-oxoacid ferredoxin oxidoreductase subunit alpha